MRRRGNLRKGRSSQLKRKAALAGDSVLAAVTAIPFFRRAGLRRGASPHSHTTFCWLLHVPATYSNSQVKDIPYPKLELDSTSSPVPSERQKRKCASAPPLISSRRPQSRSPKPPLAQCCCRDAWPSLPLQVRARRHPQGHLD